MGQLVDGVWQDTWYDTKSTGGKFVRSTAKFRNWITPDGAPGPSGSGGFKAGSGRYHLYVSLACPWAHRTLIFRELKGLSDHITMDVVHTDMLSRGWTFADDLPGATGDSVLGKEYLHEVYTHVDPHVNGRVTVPILYDKEQNTIVSNESSEIIRMFNSAFDETTGNSTDFWPRALREPMEPVNDRIYNRLNNGVYMSGFATSQSAYEDAVAGVFDTLDWLDDRLSKQRYLMGDMVTEADWRLFTTLVRFDPVYHLHFKCNRKRLIDYPALWAYSRELYQWPGVAETVDFDHIVRHYHYSHESINPHRIIPVNPDLDWDAPHGRDQLSSADAA